MSSAKCSFVKKKPSMAVDAAVAAATAGSEKQKGRHVKVKKDSLPLSIAGTMIRFTILSTIFTIIFGGILLFHNCQISEKPWIPKSKPFCNDAKWSIQNMVVRNTLKQNFYTTMESLQNITMKKFMPSAMTHANTASKLFGTWFENARNYSSDTFGNLGKFVTENYGDQIKHIIEFVKHFASDFAEGVTELFVKLLEALKVYADYGYQMINEYMEKAQKYIRDWQRPAPQQRG